MERGHKNEENIRERDCNHGRIDIERCYSLLISSSSNQNNYDTDHSTLCSSRLFGEYLNVPFNTFWWHGNCSRMGIQHQFLRVFPSYGTKWNLLRCNANVAGRKGKLHSMVRCTCNRWPVLCNWIYQWWCQRRNRL